MKVKPWLWLPPKLAHELSPLAIDFFSQFFDHQTPEWRPLTWRNLHFKNRLGLAGGIDKNADHLPAWQRLGCGFVEVGTITPRPQKPNPGVIFDRSIPDGALWNRMGFPSLGSDEAYYNLRNFKPDSTMPLLVNIGKNRDTPNELAADDYSFLIEKLHTVADAFVVNISSPNTKGLRDLTKKEFLDSFLKPIKNTRNHFAPDKPVLIKLSPDLETDDLKRILDICLQNEIDGFVLTNTTLERTTQKSFSPEGGVSGKPVSELSKRALRTTIDHLGAEKPKKLVISVGGVMTSADVFERLTMGADLVEVYTALILSGLHFFRKVEKAAHEHDKT